MDLINLIVEAIIGNGSYDLFKKAFGINKNKDVNESNNIIITDNINILSNSIDEKLDEKNHNINKISERLKKIYTGMNFNNEYEISKLADIMGLETSEELENYILGKKHPPFKFLDTFADFFGVNSSWLKFGKEAPYRGIENSKMYTEDYAEDYYEKIINLKPKCIYFIRSKSKFGESGIVLKISDFKYIILPKYYHISSHVGSTGVEQIYSFYKFIKLIKRREVNSEAYGLEIDEQQFDQLFMGKVFPGIYDSIHYSKSNWWDDFTDIDNCYFSTENYKKWYGEEFVLAQMIVKECIKQKR